WLGPGGDARLSPQGTPGEGRTPEPRDPPTEDDVYCRCLSRTLCHTATPVTVGFYAPCGQRLHSLLDKVTGASRYWDLSGFIGIYWDLSGFIGIYWDIGSYWGIGDNGIGDVGSPPCGQRLHSLLDKVTGASPIGIYRDLLGFIGIYWDLLGFIGISGYWGIGDNRIGNVGSPPCGQRLHSLLDKVTGASPIGIYWDLLGFIGVFGISGVMGFMASYWDWECGATPCTSGSSPIPSPGSRPKSKPTPS
ncbi:uncharacterized protein LOC130587848, partial [Malurus melanocephalus]|uniref:uncharacterized protein LOC130587848 n=1 Tax=Malurus melanocephalus TaxID=175006 RepID=UPI002548803D